MSSGNAVTKRLKNIGSRKGHVIPQSSSFGLRDDPLGQYLNHAKILGYLIVTHLILGHLILRRLILGYNDGPKISLLFAGRFSQKFWLSAIMTKREIRKGKWEKC